MDPFVALRLPFSFDETRLDRDLETALAQPWNAHYNRADYDGEWKIIALRSENGREDSISANDRPDYRDTPLLALCPYFREILDGFTCEKQAVRLMRLAPGAIIKEHRDHALGYEDGVFRIHIPIRTNPDVAFWVDGNRVPMQRGECWYANFNLPHRVENLGNEARIHLVLDGLRNEWSDRLFSDAGFDLSRVEKPGFRPEDLPKIIEQLELMGTDTARRMVEELRQKLA